MKLIIVNVLLTEGGEIRPILFDKDSKPGDSVFCASEGLSNIDFPNGPYIEPRRIKMEGEHCPACWINVGELNGTFENFTEVTVEEARKLDFNQQKMGYLDIKNV